MALVLTILGSVFFLIGAVMSAIAVWTQPSDTPAGRGIGAGSGRIPFDALGAALPFVVLGAAVGAVGLGLWAWRRSELKARERLREHGLHCDGVILDVVQNMRVRVNRRHPWVVRYSYQAAGTEYEGEETVMDLPEAFKAGSRVAVVYDPADPSRSALVGV